MLDEALSLLMALRNPEDLKNWYDVFKFRWRFSYMRKKQRRELIYWFKQIHNCIKWYQGKLPSHFGHPPPDSKSRIIGYGLRGNAIRTWIAVDIDRYMNHLLIPADYFKGMRVLDVGCGPIPWALVFTGCEVYGLDQLVRFYKEIGYPLDDYSGRMKYLCCSAEKIPVADCFFDAVISVNAIDHTDNFSKTAREICRVLKQRGILRFEVHYHAPTVCEPSALNDDLVLKHFGRLGIRKIHERAFTELYPSSLEKGEKLVIWTNR